MVPDFVSISFRSAANAFNRSLGILQPYVNMEGYNEANLTLRFSHALLALGADVFHEIPIGKVQRLDILAFLDGVCLRVEAKQLHRETIKQRERNSIVADSKRLSELSTSSLIERLRGSSNLAVVGCYDVLLCDCWADADSDWWMGNQSARPNWDRAFLSEYTVSSIPLPHKCGNPSPEQYHWLIGVRPSLVDSPRQTVAALQPLISPA